MIKLSSNLEIFVKRSASPLQDYALYGGAGVLGGGALGGLINYLRGESVGKGALIGGGLGGLAGLGTRGTMDYMSAARNEAAEQKAQEQAAAAASRMGNLRGGKKIREMANPLNTPQVQEAIDTANAAARMGNLRGGKKIREMANPLNTPEVQKSTETANQFKEIADRLSSALPKDLSDQDLINMLGGISVNPAEEGKVNPNQGKSVFQLSRAESEGQRLLEEYRAMVAQDETDLETLRNLLVGKPRADQDAAIAAQNEEMNRPGDYGEQIRTGPTVVFDEKRQERINKSTALAEKRRKALEALKKRGINAPGNRQGR